jgi:hypothetical protein
LSFGRFKSSVGIREKGEKMADEKEKNITPPSPGVPEDDLSEVDFENVSGGIMPCAASDETYSGSNCKLE